MRPIPVFLFAVALLVGVLAFQRCQQVDEIRPLTPPAPATDARVADALERTPTRQSVESPGRGDASGSDVASPSIAGRVRARVRAFGAAPTFAYEIVVRAEGQAPQVLAFAAAEGLVDLDLPLGRLEVQARAPALASRPLSLIQDDDAPLPPLELELLPAGGLTVSASSDSPSSLAGLPLTLVAVATQDRFRAELDAAAGAVFTDLPAGDYSVQFGAGEGGIVAPPRARVEAGSVASLGPVALPALGEALIFVSDRSNQPVAGARVFGAGQRGGWVDVWTAADGSARARFLPEGVYFLDVIVDAGPRGRGQLDVQIGRVARASIQVR